MPCSGPNRTAGDMVLCSLFLHDHSSASSSHAYTSILLPVQSVRKMALLSCCCLCLPISFVFVLRHFSESQEFLMLALMRPLVGKTGCLLPWIGATWVDFILPCSLGVSGLELPWQAGWFEFEATGIMLRKLTAVALLHWALYKC